MKKSDLIFLLNKNLEDYNEIDINLSADLIQKVIVESLKKRNRIEIRGNLHFLIQIFTGFYMHRNLEHIF